MYGDNELKVDADLFYKANNDAYSARELIGDCVKLLDNSGLQEGNDDYADIKSKADNARDFIVSCNSNIKKMIEVIEQAKARLLAHNSSFLERYSKICEEQYLQFLTNANENGLLLECDEREKNIYYKEYCLSQLATLEEKQKSGQFDPEDKIIIEGLKIQVCICEINDEINNKSLVDDEYVELVKKKRDYELCMLNLNQDNLSEKELEEAINSLSNSYDEYITYLMSESKINSYLSMQKKYKEGTYEYHHYSELILYEKSKIYYNEMQKSLKSMKECDEQIEELKNTDRSELSDVEIAYLEYKINSLGELKSELEKNYNTLEEERLKLFDYAGYEQLMAQKGNASGFLNKFTRDSIEKEIIEYKCTHNMATAAEIEFYNASGLEKAGYKFGVFTNAVASQNAKFLEGLEDAAISILTFPLAVSGEVREDVAIKDFMSDVSNYVKKDRVGSYYDAEVARGGLNQYVAYGDWKTYGDFFGATATTVATWELKFAWELSAVSEFGTFTETSLQNGDSFILSVSKSAPKAAINYLTTQVLLGHNAYTAANTFGAKQLFKNGVISMGIVIPGTVANSAIDYTLGDNMGLSFGEYFYTTGGLQKIGKKCVSALITNQVAGLKCIKEYNLEMDKRIVEKTINDKAEACAREKYDASHEEGAFDKLTSTQQHYYINGETDVAIKALASDINTFNNIKFKITNNVNYSDLTYNQRRDLMKTYQHNRSVVAKSVKSVVMSSSFDIHQAATGIDVKEAIRIDPKIEQYVWKLVGY